MSRRRQSGFTLAEMISVLIIIGIVLSIAIPAITNISKASALNTAAREVSNTLSLARQCAITHRTHARVVFAYDGTGPTGQQDMWYRAYSVITNSAHSDPTKWRYVTKWEYLPVGVTFLNDTIVGGGSLNNNAGAGRSVQTEDLPLPFPVPYNHGVLAYVEFGPTGAATERGTITIQEGFIANNGLPQPTPLNPPNYRGFFVDNIVGQVRVFTP